MIEEKLKKISVLIAAAQYQIYVGLSLDSIRFLETARFIANQPDQFIEVNKNEIDSDCKEAQQLLDDIALLRIQ